MSLDHKISEFLSSAGDRPPASKLEPYTELIRQLRQRKWTYTQIAEILRDKFNLSVAPSTIHNFVKVRSTGKKPIALVPMDIQQVKQVYPTKTETTPPKRPRFHLDP